ncbi:acetyl-CoA carboxylase biotin carboxyl carrier protein [Hansschlegelia sp.]|uniref:acetyl-CoA carboxylase biotin carboxyl carrier protein n=1 Tax=Hansschlegelia sp. TaxID=2041892 RepID=UPI002BB064D5|nr:acetyl-CoA carboxylase biotin carboxyl carrier protein [Hansschlegelia sp.]HVI29009.1 acetyl-CoA carboxylase biotin carboxyl carrier protein [Hansschlegelia sp.]
MSKATANISDQELVRELAELMIEKGLSEVEIEREDFRVRVARQTLAASAPVAAVTIPTAAAAPADPAKAQGAVLSPMVGTAYLAPEPGARPFIEVGGAVRQGQTLMIVEAMKTMNAIPAPKAGIVREILVTDGQPVEFGEPLLIVD